jgi:hypothetical protein
MMPSSISVEEHLQELQWEQWKASNHNSESRAVADGRPRLATSVRLIWAPGRRLQHLLGSDGETNIPARVKPAAASPELTQARAENPTPGAWLIWTPSVLPSVYK